MPSRGSGEDTAVTSTTVSPDVTTAAPEACFAIRPVSNCSRLPPASSTETSCFMLSSFRGRELVRGRAFRARRATGSGERAAIQVRWTAMDPFQSPRGATWDGRRPSGSLLFRFLVARALVTARSRGLLANAELGDHGPVTI